MARRVSIPRPMLVLVALIAILALGAAALTTPGGGSPGPLAFVPEAGDNDADADAGDDATRTPTPTPTPTPDPRTTPRPRSRPRPRRRKREALGSRGRIGRRDRPGAPHRATPRPPAGPASSRSRPTAPDDWEPADRRRPRQRLRLHPRDPLRRDQAVQRQLPDALHRAPRQRRRRRDVRREQAALRVQGQGPVRPDHRGRPVHRRRLRRVHERLQHAVHEVHDPRRQLDRRRSRCSATVSWTDKPVLATSNDGKDVYVDLQRPDGRRPVDRAVARLRRDLGADQARRLQPLLLRVRCRRGRRTAPSTSRRAACSTAAAATRARTRRAPIEEHVFISRNARRQPGRTSSSRPSSPGWRARSAAARPTTGWATTPSASTALDGSVVAYDGAATTRGLQTIAARRSTDAGATWSARRDAVERRPSRRSTRRSSRRAAATSAPGTCRRRGRATSTSGTPGTGGRPTAARRGRRP